MAIELGNRVKQVVPVIEGEVVGAALDMTKLTTLYLVRWENEEGEVIERYFTENELEVVS